jgi:hypothetical protein
MKNLETKFDIIFEQLENTDVTDPEWDILTREYILLSTKISVSENHKKYI